MAVRQYQELLRKSVLLRRVVKIDVAEEIINGGKPRRGEIADARHLHRRRLIRQHRQSAAPGMPCQIDENIDAVFIYLPRCVGGRSAKNIAPAVNLSRQRPAFLVFRGIHVSVDFKPRPVIRRKQRRAKTQHDVIPEIRRNVADPKLFLRLSPAMKKRRHILKKHAVSRRSPPPLRGGGRRQIVRVEKIIAVFERRQPRLRSSPGGRQIRRYALLAPPQETAALPQKIIDFFLVREGNIFFPRQCRQFSRRRNRFAAHEFHPRR